MPSKRAAIVVLFNMVVYWSCNVIVYILTDCYQVWISRLQSLELDKKIGLDHLTPARAEEALELTEFVLVNIQIEIYCLSLTVIT